MRAGEKHVLERNQVLLDIGHKVPGIGLVMDGAVKLSVGRANAKRVYRVAGAGESFLEAPTIARSSSPFEVRAIKQSVVLALPTKEIEAALKRCPRFAIDLIAVLAERTMSALEDLHATTLPIEGRVARYLLSIAKTQTRRRGHVVIPLPKVVLAARLGMKKESLSRALRSLSDDGLIAVEGRRIILLDRAALSRCQLSDVFTR